ncbi:hypothetical protein K7I13_12185 [Brucepastera parasyntrophica]|uniref:hypothetical protein n=1 Tax=Brucepastera parasyntrophica TaxID=2880008 RepID=UPI002109B2AD|nr:hypothetical protein [Brucepastera parasyntrophica]ULQ59244.1 hypothetical protein K7I13_12185 [Brucepastera parasyntrophica]
MNELKDTGRITDYLEKTLKSWNFDVRRSFSGMSDSEYIEICFEEKDNIKIRISGHDLPPSYDNLHGLHNFDICTKAERMGNAGTAQTYVTFLNALAAHFNRPLPAHVVRVIEENKKESERLAGIREAQARKVEAEYQEKENNLEKMAKWAAENRPEQFAKIADYYTRADTVTGDKRQKLRRRARELEKQLIGEMNNGK